ncbi:MAG: Slp family lipoprotein [candidate division NC10 bacterium]|nr:Slp family lipoprotein [candidate division NC10 bacterium]
MKWNPEREEGGVPGGTCWRTAPRLFGFLFIFLILTGCSVVPRELRREVDRSISFQELKQDPDAYVGRKVLLGGEIIETRVLQDEAELEILQKPLGSGDAPVETDQSGGRFLVQKEGYLDPAIYRSGRYVTVVGEVMGEKTLRIGEADYRYPILTAKFLHLWPTGRRYYYSPYFDPYYPYYYPPYYPYGGFWFYYYRPYYPWGYPGYDDWYRHRHKK